MHGRHVEAEPVRGVEVGHVPARELEVRPVGVVGEVVDVNGRRAAGSGVAAAVGVVLGAALHLGHWVEGDVHPVLVASAAEAVDVDVDPSRGVHHASVARVYARCVVHGAHGPQPGALLERV